MSVFSWSRICKFGPLLCFFNIVLFGGVGDLKPLARGRMIHERHLCRELNMFCDVRDGDSLAMPLCDETASKNNFYCSCGYVKRPAWQMFERKVQRKPAVTVFTSSSKYQSWMSTSSCWFLGQKRVLNICSRCSALSSNMVQLSLDADVNALKQVAQPSEQSNTGVQRTKKWWYNTMCCTKTMASTGIACGTGMSLVR